MKKYLFFLLITLFMVFSAKAQDCKIFIPDQEGVKLEYEMKNGKGKSQGTYSQKLVSIEEDGDATVFKLEQISTDKKGNEMQNTYEFKCVGNTFIIDMNTFIDEQQMAAYEDMEMTVTSDEIAFPSDIEPGMELKDGSINMEVATGPVTLNFSTFISNRKAEAIERITTAAGTFECIKISQDVEGKYGFVKASFTTVDWYVENIGLIRNETYNKKGKLQSVTELINIEK